MKTEKIVKRFGKACMWVIMGNIILIGLTGVVCLVILAYICIC